ncbi:MAG: ABC transporter substrate-binding protein [Lachnospiraceae bacterium]|nr:ABC transporter substrate-binding protein [Lachnospiraceae bacterium]
MKRMTAFFLAAALVVSMAGCGGSGSKGEVQTGAAGEAGAQSGKDSITIATDVDIDTLHPSDFSTTIEHTILTQLYDPLMYMNPDGAHEPEPRIAESYTVSDDGKDYTFKLRSDVTFHDGSAVTADDVKFSLELYMNSEYQGSQVAGLESVEVPDASTVICHLDNPYSPFLLGVCQVPIASKAYYEKSESDFSSQPVGSGPYKYTGREKGSKITLEAYDGYYRGEAAIKNVTYEVIPDQSTTAIALKTGEVDFAMAESSTMAQIQGDEALTVEEVGTSGFSYISMNLEKEPFNDVRVRQAINHAVNRENIAAVCYDNEAEINSNICSKERFGYSDDQFQYTYDPEKAKELLAEAGVTTPLNLGTILVAEKYSNLATVIQSDLAAVGLEVTIEVKEFNAYIDDLTSGNYDITALEMTLDGDTQQLEMAFCSDYIGTANNARYSDPDMDDLFAQAKAETDTDKREAIFDQIFTKAQDEAIYAVICNPMTLYVHHTDLDCQEIPFEGIYSIYNFSWK